MGMFVRDHVGERAVDLGHLDERPFVVLHGVLGAGLPELLVAILHVMFRHAHHGADGDGVLEADGALVGAEIVSESGFQERTKWAHDTIFWWWRIGLKDNSGGITQTGLKYDIS